MKKLETIFYSTLLISVLKGGVNSAKLKGSTDVDQIRHDYFLREKDAWSIVNKIDLVANQKDEDLKRQRNVILKELIHIYQDFAYNSITAKDDYDENNYLILKRFYEWQLLESDLINIHTLFDAMRQFLQRQNSLPDDDADFDLASEDFADTVLKDPHWPVNTTLEQIESIMLRQGLYFKAATQAKSTICTFGLSAQQVLYQLYNAISITELKGYSMMQFSWMLLRTYGKGNFTTEADLMRERFEIRMNKTQSILQRVMERSDREVWRCDPQSSKHQNGETYLEITRLLQGYVENEVNMNTEETCKENCAYYNGVQQETCYKDLYCAQQKKCSGKIYDCQYVDSDMWICPASEGSSRRYEYIEYESGKVLGNKKYCPRGTTKVDSWWRWVFWHCSYCFCLCDDAGPKSDRYFNMRETVSDISENKVVTGVRFIKKNRIIHLQIQQGKLLPRGNIENTTLTWVEPSSYKILDANIRNNFDYYTLSWDNRAIDLDDLMAPPSYVVTGVRFRKIGSHLNLEIRITEIDFGTGELIDPTVINWVSSDYTENSDPKRTEVVMDHPDIPTKTHTNSIPISVSNQFIKFRASDFSKDASQTTIPFIDAQPCVSAKPSPLAGVGLFYKGANKFGGFITPKAFTYDLGPHIQKPTIPQGTEYYEVV